MEVEKDSASSIATSKSGQSAATSQTGDDSTASVDEQTRLWTTVRGNPSDFTSWTSLLQIVEQKGEIGVVREVFNTFFKYYPYCYGYWKKMADFEKTHAGIDTAKQVYERGVEAVAMSTDIWLHYIKFMTSIDAENKEAIRSLYDRALTVCGMEYRSGKLWDAYLSWDKANPASPAHTLAIYDRLLATPTQQLQQHFDNFKKFLEENTAIADVLSKEEYSDLCTQVESKEEADVEKAVREKVLEKRTAVFEKSKEEVRKRVKFEDAIKRPYFHVKPLEKTQLKTWKDYLDFEVSEGDQQRVLVLFERCMIACALYEEFWTKFASYAELHDSSDLARSVYKRACTIHLQNKPRIHVAWATFEEKQGNTDKAREILKNIDSVVPGLVIIRQGRIGLEYRRRRYPEVESLYRSYLEDSSLTSEARNFYSWRYAKFAARVLGDHPKAVQLVREAISKDDSNSRPLLYLQLLDLETSRFPPSESAIEAVFEEVKTSEMNNMTKAMFAQRRVTFLQEFGYDVNKLVSAKEELAKLRGQAGIKRSKDELMDTDGEPAKRVKLDSSATGAGGSGDQATPTMVTPTAAPPTSVAATTQPTDPQQQWAAAYQQQWGAYPYGQPGYNYQQYYSQYPQTYSQTSSQ